MPTIARFKSPLPLLILAFFRCGVGVSIGAPDDCRLLLEQAQDLLAQQRAEQARVTISSALAKCPVDAQAYDLLGIIYDQRGFHAEAERAFRKAISLDPDRASFHNNAAMSCLHAQKTQAAAVEFGEALRLDPHNSFAGLNLAEICLQRNHYRQALRYLQLCGARTSADPELVMALAEACFGAGSRDVALETVEKLSVIAAADPKVHFSLGLLLARYDQYPEAIKQFQFIPVQERDSATYENLGMAYMELGNTSEARVALETAMRLDPANPDLYVRLAQIYSISHRPDEAAFLLTQASQLAPQRTDITFQLAEVLIEAGLFARADNLLSDAVKQHPSDAALLQALGDLNGQRHQDGPALQAYQESLIIDPRRIDSRVGLARVDELMGKIADAQSEYEEGLRIDSTNATVNAGLGEIAFKDGRLIDATHYLQKALMRAPDNLEAGELLASVYIRQEDYVQAEEILRRLIRLDLDNPRTHYMLGQVLLKLGKHDESALEFEKSRHQLSQRPVVETQ